MGMQVWSLEDNSIITTILGHKKPITHMRLLDGYLYASGGRKVSGSGVGGRRRKKGGKGWQEVGTSRTQRWVRKKGRVWEGGRMWRIEGWNRRQLATTLPGLPLPGKAS